LAPYHALGVRTVLTSAVTGTGIDTLCTLLHDKLTVLAGLSGVGKSSLLAAAEPGLNLRTGVVSEHSGAGRHTTTQATLFALAAGGAVVDTPGIREFGLAGLTPRELADSLPDVAALASDCRFNDCTHRDEPGCAVKAGMKTGALAKSRYHSYKLIYDSLS